MSMSEALAVGGAYGRIKPANFTPSDGDWAVSFGCDQPGVFALLKHGEESTITQTGDFDTTEIMRLRARTRAPAKLPWVVKQNTTATGTYILTIDGADHSYAADTAGLTIGSGAAASIDSRDGDETVVSGLTGMTAASVGRQLVVSGAASGANNGTFPIDRFIDANSVGIRNPAGVPGDANNGSISWTERRRPDNATTIAQALTAAVNASTVAMSARMMQDGHIQLDPDEGGVSHTIEGSVDLDIARVTWTFAVLIDASVRCEQQIEDEGRVRDRLDFGTLIEGISAGDHDLVLRLRVETSPPMTTAIFEAEIPGVYVDQLVLT